MLGCAHRLGWQNKENCSARQRVRPPSYRPDARRRGSADRDLPQPLILAAGSPTRARGDTIDVIAAQTTIATRRLVNAHMRAPSRSLRKSRDLL